jgi:hypothetical protein
VAVGAASSVLRPAQVPPAGSTTRPSIPVSASKIPPVGRTHPERLHEPEIGERFLATANALPQVRALRAEYPRSTGFVTELSDGNWEVTYVTPNGNLPSKEIGMVTIDGHSGRVLEQLTGIQLDWEMARGYPGFFGKHVNALYIWLPLCLLFMLPFVNFRRPFSLLHLDLLVLLSFSVSLAFFNHAHIYASVPLIYPPLIYLLARMLALMRRGSRPEAPPARPCPMAGARGCAPDRLSRRAERHRLERGRYRLCGRYRRAADRPGQVPVRLLSLRPRTR